MINFIRIIKVVDILLEIQTLRVIYYTLSGLIEPMTLLLFMAIMIFYVYAVVGLLLYGGKLHRGSTGGAADIYYLVNMNDFPNAIFTLFCLMIVNNWPVFTNMYQTVNGGSVYNRFYFYSFVILANWLLMNLTQAAVLDVHASVETLDKERSEWAVAANKERQEKRKKETTALKQNMDQLKMVLVDLLKKQNNTAMVNAVNEMNH